MLADSALSYLSAMTGETDEDVLSAYFELAGQRVLAKAFPYDDTQTVVPDRYFGVQLEIAAFMLNKRGAEGETSHSENGITRVYGNGDLPTELTRDITPYCGVPVSSSEESDD